MNSSKSSNSFSTPSLLLQHGYRYVELIGEGANGKTYKSQNLKTGEIVAIKALKFSDNLKNYELFEREAETLKSLHTSGTPVFYDYIAGEGEFTECWLVQEYVQGESILDKLEKGEQFGEVQTLEIILEAANIIRMLQTQYAPPIIHRDIKPSNILVRNDTHEGGKLCLIDFGAVANPQKRGMNSTVAGTVGYMAPEQLMGDCSIQSDYYALGATALHMLTGMNPTEFVADGFKLQFEEELEKRGIRIETIELMYQLLDPDAEERPENANELVQQIADVLSSINAAVVEKRKKLATGLRIVKSNIPLGTCVVGGLLFCAVYERELSKFGSFACVAFICVFIIFISVFFAVIEMKLTNQLKQLPNYNIREENIKKLAVIDDVNSSNRMEVEGEIVKIVDDVVEYIVYIEDKYYTAFYCNTGNYPYKVGDKVKVKYGRKFDISSLSFELRITSTPELVSNCQ